MRTDDLIERLSQDVAPVGGSLVTRRMLAALAAGALATLAIVLMRLGVRPDIMVAMHGAAFWIKIGYTASLAGVAVYLTARLARPDEDGDSAWLVFVPIAVLAFIAVAQLLNSPRSEWLAMWLGATWQVCSIRILLLSLPLLAGFTWAFRRFAPTRLSLAGAAAGLAAGATAASLYCLHCPEATAPFVLTWYTLGMALSALLGALLGPRMLRW